MKEVKAIIKPFRLDAALHALHSIEGIGGVTVSEAAGINVEYGSLAQVPMSKLELIVSDALVEAVVTAIERNASTGNPGDGRISVLPVEQFIRIRTGERSIV